MIHNVTTQNYLTFNNQEFCEKSYTYMHIFIMWYYKHEIKFK